jgi:hypothetical protein
VAVKVGGGRHVEQSRVGYNGFGSAAVALGRELKRRRVTNVTRDKRSA